MDARVVPMEISDGKLAVEFRGRGPTVLLLHGLSGNRFGWDAVAERLKRRFSFVLPDLLSRGESEVRPDLPYSLEHETRRVRELLARLDPPPRLLVGHSQGATLALALAREPAVRKAGVRGVVLASPVTPWTSRPRILAALRSPPVRRGVAATARLLRRPFTRFVLWRVFGPDTPVTADLVDKYAGPYADPRRTEALMRIVYDWRPQELDEPEALGISGLILIGAHDPRVLPKDAAALARRLELPLWTAHGSGHVLPDEAPEFVSRAIREVAERALGRASGTGSA